MCAVERLWGGVKEFVAALALRQFLDRIATVGWRSFSLDSDDGLRMRA
jgi:hypothetical protein